MSSFWRAVVVIAVGAWMFGTLVPQIGCLWRACPSNGLSLDFDGAVIGVDPGSPAQRASIAVGDLVAPPVPRDLFVAPPPAVTFALIHGSLRRSVDLRPQLAQLTQADAWHLLALCASYAIFLIVGSIVLLLRPSAMTWTFYLFCVVRRFGDLGFYWPGGGAFYWTNFLVFAAFGGAGCALVAMFALRFPRNKLDGWRRRAYPIATLLAVLLPFAWVAFFVRLTVYGLPSQALWTVLVVITSAIYLTAAGIFLATLATSHGDERQRLRWILVFPIVLILRVVAINVPYALPTLYSDALIVLGVSVPITVAYAIVRRRVFDIEFAISRALVYGVITSIIAGTFLLLDWFMSGQFAASRLTLTAEVIVALALGSALNMLHRNVDRLVDGTFFRQRHRAEKRLARAAAAMARAESPDAVDRFLAHEPVEALDLAWAAIFHRERTEERFVREVTVGTDRCSLREFAPDHPLVLHLLAESAPVRLADVAWTADESFDVGGAVLAAPVMLGDELLAIVLYGPHRTGADIDPDETRSISRLTESAGAAYHHIEARALREQVEALLRERDVREREIAFLRAQSAGHTPA